ncbi:hypothetical protein B0H19DRAFT_1070008 [Mycena capillaripes]|nr:hypothetical protein B0H19DRAFT_1070008 [Mycena capillaripes]
MSDGISDGELLIVALLFCLFVHWLLDRRARWREPFAGPGKMLRGAAPVKAPLPQSNPNEMPTPTHMATQPSEHGADYPPSSHPSSRSASFSNVSPPDAPSSHPPSGPSPAPSSTAEPGVGSPPAARQAYLAAELRAAQTKRRR